MRALLHMQPVMQQTVQVPIQVPMQTVQVPVQHAISLAVVTVARFRITDLVLVAVPP